MKILIIIILFFNYSSIFSQHSFIRPFKLGSYYEYVFEETYSSIRYSARIVSQDTAHGRIYQRMDVYNEPPMTLHSLYFSFDTITFNLYGGENVRCPDSLGNMLAIGFNLPEGYIWNDCPMGSYFKSTITLNSRYTGFFGTDDTLGYVERKDTVGAPIEGTTYYAYAEKFGYVLFYRGYGSPLLGGPYSKQMVGAVIDGVTYGTILLDINLISNEIPSGFKLEQNFPNPFNPSTIIKFSVPGSSFVSLKIFDQLGKEISVLVNEKKSAGSYQYVFNANGISSGIYFYTLQTEDFTESKRMVLLK